MKNKKIIMTALFVLVFVSVGLSSIIPTDGFTTEKGNEWNFIWGERDSRPMMNRSLEWIPYINYGNGTIISGHFDWEYHNFFTVKVPYIIGITINGKDYYRNYNFIDNRSFSSWSVPIGDRNLEEFGRCRDYEIEKGVCINNEI